MCTHLHQEDVVGVEEIWLDAVLLRKRGNHRVPDHKVEKRSKRRPELGQREVDGGKVLVPCRCPADTLANLFGLSDDPPVGVV